MKRNLNDILVVLAIGVCLVALCCPGCAALPMSMQPTTDETRTAEGIWDTLDTIDTLQTMHIERGQHCDHEADVFAAAIYGGKYPKPGRVAVTNILLMVAHSTVSGWLDDEVAKHDAANDGSVGPWYVGRIVWHGASIVASGASVINNKSLGCRL